MHTLRMIGNDTIALLVAILGVYNSGKVRLAPQIAVLVVCVCVCVCVCV